MSTVKSGIYRAALSEFEPFAADGRIGLVRRGYHREIAELFQGGVQNGAHGEFWIKQLKPTECDDVPPARFVNNVTLFDGFNQKGYDIAIPRPIALVYLGVQEMFRDGRGWYIARKIDGVSPHQLEQKQAREAAIRTMNSLGSFDDWGVRGIAVLLDVAPRDIVVDRKCRPWFVDNEGVLWGADYTNNQYRASVSQTGDVRRFGIKTCQSRSYFYEVPPDAQWRILLQELEANESSPFTACLEELVRERLKK